LRPFPAAAESLTIRQIGNRIQLQWSAPSLNTDRTTEKLELAQVEVRRRVIDIQALVEAQTLTIEPEATTASREAEEAALVEPPPDDASPPLEPSMTEPELEEAPKAPPVPSLVIPSFSPESRVAATLESTAAGEIQTFEEDVDPAWPGKRLEYAVIYTNRGGRRGEMSAIVQIEPVATLSAPAQPVADTGDGFVELRWSGAAPAAGPEGEPPPSFYSVFRRAESAPGYPDRPLNGQPISVTELVDRSVVFGVGVCYVVKSVAPPPEPPQRDEPAESTAEPTEVTPSTAPVVVVPEIPPLRNPVSLESEPSLEVCLVPTDTFAPPAPTGLVAVRSGDAVMLTWTEVERPDVVGYRVYRAGSRDGPFELLNEDLLRVPTHTDDTLVPGERYYYGITSLDDAPAANESEMSELTGVTFAQR
jgi:hypothetical protein